MKKEHDKGKDKDKDRDRVVLFNDPELWALIERSGMKVDEQIKDPKAYNPDITYTEALALKKRFV